MESAGTQVTGVREALGVDDDWFDWMNEPGCCWICAGTEGQKRKLAVDHDHLTGAVRGLLCASCNITIGGIRNPSWLRRAADYLEAAARAFGDECKKCHRSAPSRVVNGPKGEHQFDCCGEKWSVFFETNGVPVAWMLGADPRPDDNRELCKPRDPIGFPDERSW